MSWNELIRNGWSAPARDDAGRGHVDSQSSTGCEDDVKSTTKKKNKNSTTEMETKSRIKTTETKYNKLC